MKENQAANPATRRARLRRGGLVLLAVLLLGAIPAAAWLAYQRQIAAVGKIGDAYSIVIGAGAGENMSYINISGIDMSKSERVSRYVFSVLSDSATSYKLQLAYTTNNPFEYTLYHAKKLSSDGAGAVAYQRHTDDPTTEYYGKDTELAYIAESSRATYIYTTNETPGHQLGEVKGRFLNLNETTKLADGSKHSYSYGDYDKVEAHAEPLYWQTDTLWNIQSKAQGGPEPLACCDYYILEVSWPDATSAQINNRETDILYITAYSGA